MSPAVRTVLVPLLLGLAACRRPSPLPTIVPGPPDQVRDVSLMNGFITVRLEIPTSPPGPKPAVISPIAERDLLLQSGAVVVTYQVHWEKLTPLLPAPPGPAPETPATPPAPKATVGVWLLASPTPATIGKGYFELIEGTARSQISAVIDYLVTVPEIDPHRIGIGGTSTNGFKALQLLAFDRRVAAAVIFSACGDYHCFLERSNLAMNGKPLELDKKYDAWLRQREPIRHPRRYVHAAILMVNGTEDQAVPYPCMERTEAVFRRAYEAAGVPERFRTVAIPGGDHSLDERATQEAIAWWFRWLLPPGRPPGR